MAVKNDTTPAALRKPLDRATYCAALDRAEVLLPWHEPAALDRLRRDPVVIRPKPNKEKSPLRKNAENTSNVRRPILLTAPVIAQKYAAVFRYVPSHTGAVMTAKYLKIPEACAYAGLSRTALYILMAQQKIIARKSGRSTLIDRESLDRHLENLPRAEIKIPSAA